MVRVTSGSSSPRATADVQETQLFADPYVIAVRKGHRLALQRTIAARDLAAFDWVVPQRNVPRRAVIDALLARLPDKPPLVVETSSLPMMMAMLVESDCITVLPRSQIDELYPGSAMAALELEAPEASRVVGYTQRPDWLGTPVQQAFVEFLCAECAGQRRKPRDGPGRAAGRG
ncbi:LysR substrate-binding domain-containing protein [Burkholderia plantarii]|nr:LysR substrate-binding domain-containing protein [Burkholderia plantarii]